MIRWGVLGTGNIARRFIKSLAHSKTGELVAIASTNPQTREEFKYVTTHSEYEDLLNDSNVDAVYVATPHKYHAQWCIKALQHKKAVLCEKPITLNVKDLNEIIEAAKENNTFFMEAMKTKFTPAYKQLVIDVHSGIIGDILKIEAGFCSDALNYLPKTSYIFDLEQGGSWYDVSSYPISFALPLIQQLPTSIEVKCVDKEGIDHYVKATLHFNNVVAILESAIDRAKSRTALITGTKGTIEVEVFNRTEKYIIHLDNEDKEILIPLAVDDFFDQIEEVNHCLKNNEIQSTIHSWQDSIEEIEIIEKVAKKIKSKDM